MEQNGATIYNTLSASRLHGRDTEVLYSNFPAPGDGVCTRTRNTKSVRGVTSTIFTGFYNTPTHPRKRGPKRTEIDHLEMRPGLTCFFFPDLVSAFSLTGPVPPGLGTLAALKNLSLRGNYLSGELMVKLRDESRRGVGGTRSTISNT